MGGVIMREDAEPTQPHTRARAQLGAKQLAPDRKTQGGSRPYLWNWPRPQAKTQRS